MRKINPELTAEQVREIKEQYNTALKKFIAAGHVSPYRRAALEVNCHFDINENEFRSCFQNIKAGLYCIDVITAQMGSCRCGDCHCHVYADGSIEYDGMEAWQRSERRIPVRAGNGAWDEPHRKYGSELSEASYNEAMRLAKLAVKKIPSWAAIY